MKKILLLTAIIALSLTIQAQTWLNIGIGKTSGGSGTAKISLTQRGKLMPYMRMVNDKLTNPDNSGTAGYVGTEHDEFTAGLMYQCADIAFFIGAGKYCERIGYNSAPMQRESRTRTDVSAEIGFNYMLTHWHWGNISVDGTLNCYSGVSLIVSLGLKIRK